MMKLETNLILNVEEKTQMEYNAYKLGDDELRLVDAGEVEAMLEDLIHEINRLEEKIEDMEQDIRDNYTRIPVENQYE